MATNLKQLAQELGLDYSTVSYALSGKGSVSEATRQRVREAAEKAGYVPNGLVRRMRAKQTRTLGLVLPDTILHYNELIQQLYRGTAALGYELRIALTEFQIEAEDRAVRSLLEDRADGIIVRSRFATWEEVPANAALRQAATSSVPVVTYGPTLADSPFPKLELPVGARTQKAAEHLLALGHQHLACLLPTEMPIFGPHISAINGMKAALAQYNLDPNSLVVLALEAAENAEIDDLDGNYGNYLHEILPRRALQRGRTLLHQAMALNPRPTGIVCYNAVVAIGVLQEAQELGLEIPHNLALVAVTRTLIAELSPISLTTCDVPTSAAATATLELLFEAMEGKVSGSERRTLEPVLIEGESTVGKVLQSSGIPI